MSTAELIEAIEALPPEKQKEVESFVRRLSQDKDKTVPFEKAVDAVFTKHVKLLGELAK